MDSTLSSPLPCYGPLTKAASEKGHCSIVAFLITAGAEVNLQDEVKHTTALLCVVDSEQVILPLISSEFQDGRTPLMDSAFRGFARCVDALLKAGAKPEMLSKWGSALDAANDPDKSASAKGLKVKNTMVFVSL